MDQPQTGSESPGYYILVEDTSTQTTERDFYILEHTRDAGTQTEEEFISLETTRDASTQISEEENGSLELFISGEYNSDFTSEHSEEKRKRTTSSEDDTDAYKRSRPTVSGVDNVKKTASGVDIFPVRITSWCLEDNSSSKLCEENVQYPSPLELQPSAEIKERVRVALPTTCSHCKRLDSKHMVIEDGKNKYKCCQCEFLRRDNFTYDNFSYLMTHVYNEHIRHFHCHSCQMNYSDLSTHAPNQTCTACSQKFDCKYKLEKHYFSVHEYLNQTHCIICKEEYYKHFSEDAKKYQCCVCDFSDKKKSCLISHLNAHFPLKIYECKVCFDHFKRPSERKRHLQGTHPLCSLCKKRFINKHFLYIHLTEEHREK